MYLDRQAFRAVVEATPLVSIDLVVTDSQQQVLLGLRNNRPAEGFWFVPGGRVRKGERLDEAFKRLCADELGIQADRSAAALLGPDEHFYSDSVFGAAPSTHYVVFAYHLRISSEIAISADIQQHSAMRWWSLEQASMAKEVHAHTQAYLRALLASAEGKGTV